MEILYRRVAVILWVMGDDPSVAFRRCAWGTGRLLLLLGVLLRERLEMDILLFYILLTPLLRGIDIYIYLEREGERSIVIMRITLCFSQPVAAAAMLLLGV
jgi:hypothetical protein